MLIYCARPLLLPPPCSSPAQLCSQFDLRSFEPCVPPASHNATVPGRCALHDHPSLADAASPLPPLPQFDQGSCACEDALAQSLKAVGIDSTKTGLQGGEWHMWRGASACLPLHDACVPATPPLAVICPHHCPALPAAARGASGLTSPPASSCFLVVPQSFKFPRARATSTRCPALELMDAPPSVGCAAPRLVRHLIWHSNAGQVAPISWRRRRCPAAAVTPTAHAHTSAACLPAQFDLHSSPLYDSRLRACQW